MLEKDMDWTVRMPYFAIPAYTKKSLKWFDFKDLRSFAKLFGGADGTLTYTIKKFHKTAIY